MCCLPNEHLTLTNVIVETIRLLFLQVCCEKFPEPFVEEFLLHERTSQPYFSPAGPGRALDALPWLRFLCSKDWTTIQWCAAWEWNTYSGIVARRKVNIKLTAPNTIKTWCLFLQKSTQTNKPPVCKVCCQKQGHL